MNAAYYAGILITKLVDEKQIQSLKVSMVIIATVVLMIDGYGESNIKIREISQKLRNGIYAEQYNAYKDFIYRLNEHDAGEDVRISKNDFPVNIDNTYNFYLSEDPSNWVNQSVAEYYEFNSIALYSE